MAIPSHIQSGALDGSGPYIPPDLSGRTAIVTGGKYLHLTAKGVDQIHGPLTTTDVQEPKASVKNLCADSPRLGMAEKCTMFPPERTTLTQHCPEHMSSSATSTTSTATLSQTSSASTSLFPLTILLSSQRPRLSSDYLSSGRVHIHIHSMTNPHSSSLSQLSNIPPHRHDLLPLPARPLPPRHPTTPPPTPPINRHRQRRHHHPHRAPPNPPALRIHHTP